MADPVERLTNLLALLLETTEPLSLHQIASALEGMYPDGQAARRGAFERDKSLLREIGVPIETEMLTAGSEAGQTRYRIDRRRYELADLHLNDDERRALQLAVAATRSGSVTAQAALWKLGVGAAEEPSVTAAPLPAPAPLSAPLAVLRDAVASRATVTFGYRGIERDVEPHGLLLRDGFWYLVGHDRTRGERRTYRVDRLEGTVAMGNPGGFEPADTDVRSAFPADPKLIALGPDDGDTPVAAVVRIDDPQASLLERELGAESVLCRYPDGSAEFSIEYRNPEALRSWVLGFGPAAEVVSPAEVRNDVIAWLSAMAAAR